MCKNRLLTALPAPREEVLEDRKLVFWTGPQQHMLKGLWLLGMPRIAGRRRLEKSDR